MSVRNLLNCVPCHDARRSPFVQSRIARMAESFTVALEADGRSDKTIYSVPVVGPPAPRVP